jgi:inosine-uridine nucleoside N-ribohydrolase
MSEKKIPLWIDTDTGVDDAVMLMCATKLDKLDIKGVSAVSGNVSEDKTFRNARAVLSLCGREDIKVYPGATRPLIVEQYYAEYVHGFNGLGGAIIPDSNAPIETEHAYDAMYRVAKELNGELTVAAVGPFTNIAIAITKYPDITKYIKELVVMGGAVVGGNATPSAEFNIYADPHAAETVFKSGIPVKMFGLDVTMKSSLTMEEIEKIYAGTTPRAKLFHDSTSIAIGAYEKRLGEKKVCLHDVCPVLYLVYPELFTLYKAGVYVETESEITFGKTVCDLYSDFKFEDRHCEVAMDVKRDEFAKIVEDLLLSE